MTAASLALRAYVPPLIIADASYDDLMFVKAAHNLLNGRWLGPFDPNFTLAKGVGYPSFVALCHLLGLPVLMAQQGLHLLVSGWICWVVYKLTGARLLAVALYSVLALDPSYFGTMASRIVRDNWYASVCLLLVTLAARRLTWTPGLPRPLRTAAYLRALALSAFFGLTLAAYWLGREERPWLLPALGFVVLSGMWLESRGRTKGSSWKGWLNRSTLQRTSLALMALGLGTALVAGVAQHNKQTYGVFLTNDITEGQFAQAFGQWQAVRSGPVRPYVTLSRAQRAAVYEVSPAARELEPILEGPVGARWVARRCKASGVCDDISGGWTQWALRQALADTGRYPTARETQGFWRRLSSEIASGCSARRLMCRQKTPFLLPQTDTIRVGAYTDSAVAGAWWVVGFHVGDQLPARSSGRPADWALFSETVRGLPSGLDAEVQREKEFSRHAGSVNLLGDVYRLVSFPLLVVALFGYLSAMVRRRPGWLRPFLLGVGTAVAVVSRVGFLALADSTSFPASSSVYQLPASSLLIVFVAIGLWLLAQSLKGMTDPRTGLAQAESAGPGPSTSVVAGAPEITVVLPCLNEAQTLEVCIAKATRSLREQDVDFEVLVADNGSTDGSQDIARRAGARVVDIATRGYGAALRGGIAAARGRYVLMADADDSYALDDIGPFLTSLREGHDLVVGNRFLGGIEPGAMPALHRYLGNPVLSLVGRVFFKIPVRDFHCGMRAFDRDLALQLDLRSDGMEFASEMIVKFALTGHRIAEVPTVLRPDGRDRPPHLRSWRDGWRHLRFLLLFSPRWLFLYPGAGLALVGALLMLRLSVGPAAIGSVVLDSQSLLFAGAAVVIGAQAILFAILSRTYAAARGILPATPRLKGTSHPFALERGLGFGVALLALGAVGSVVAVVTWAHHSFGPLSLAASMRLAIPTVTLLILGAEILMASFFLGLLQLDQHISDPLPTTESPSVRVPQFIEQEELQ